VGEHDLVIASYSLSFLDMREALLKMDQLAKRQVILYWFAGVPSWERIRVDLYPGIFGREHICHPMSDVLYNLLYSMGIYADVQVLQGTAFPREYESLEEGISELQRAPGAEHAGARRHDQEVSGEAGTAGGRAGDVGG